MKLKNPTSRSFLNRYTTLPVLLDILMHRRIVLLNPSSWEDRNDSHYLERYKEEKKLKTVVALCFSQKRETFHHWKVFTGGSAGVCIEFDKERLLKPLATEQGLLSREVKYRYIKEVVAKRPRTADWPFLKRKPFEDEGEFRLVYQSASEELPVKEFGIALSCINKVTLSPWMPSSVADTVKSVIAIIDGCGYLRVEKSSLLETTKWKAAIRSQNL